MPSDVAQVVASAHALHLIRTGDWPMLSAELLTLGFDGAALTELAGLPRTISGWELDSLRPRVLAELGLEDDVPVEDAGDLMARLLAANLHRPFVRRLAEIAPNLDYPGGAIGRSYQLAEYLDCDCHPEGAREAEAFEDAVGRLGPLEVPVALAEALVGYL